MHLFLHNVLFKICVLLLVGLFLLPNSLGNLKTNASVNNSNRVTQNFNNNRFNDIPMLSIANTTSRSISGLPSNFKERFVDGGITDYAYNKKGLSQLRDYYGNVQLVLFADGLTAGAFISGNSGALIGEVGAWIAYIRLMNVQSDVKQLISEGKHQGGVRVTLTDEYTIGKFNPKAGISFNLIFAITLFSLFISLISLFVRVKYFRYHLKYRNLLGIIIIILIGFLIFNV